VLGSCFGSRGSRVRITLLRPIDPGLSQDRGFLLPAGRWNRRGAGALGKRTTGSFFMRRPSPQRDRMRADEIAAPAELRFSCDTEAGWRRLRRGRGFAYLGPDGQRPDAAELARLRALAIPPAWSAVWICRD